MTWADAEDLGDNVAGLEMVAPYTSTWGQPLYADHPLDMPVLGVTRAFADINKLEMARGRFISDLDGYAFFGVLGGLGRGQAGQAGGVQPPGQEDILQETRLFDRGGAGAHHRGRHAAL